MLKLRHPVITGRAAAGDTIVEVMIAMAILGLVLGTSYATAAQSLQVGRRAQERTEATKLVEAQLEQLKFYSKDAAMNIFNTAAGARQFCIKNGTKHLIAGSFDDHVSYPAECKDGLYSVGVQYDPAANDTFIVQARWDRLGNLAVTENVLVRYRMHP